MKKKENEEIITIRPRKLDIDKKLLVLLPKDLSSQENLKRSIKNQGFDKNLSCTELISKEGIEFLTNDDEEESVFVPVPQVTVKEIQEKTKSKTFRRPKNYIKYEKNKKRIEIANQYDMDEKDEEFIKNYNETKVERLSELNFERIYALIEEEALQKYGFSSIFRILENSKNINIEIPLNDHDIYAVREYWIEKNKEKVENLEKKVNQVEIQFQDQVNLRKIRIHFEKLRVLMDLIIKREKLKRKILNLDILISGRLKRKR